ncbi:asparagine synthase (glutamine-hydrolysing) [Ancylomarina subtilis]|uniref:asparagine synthase (glutamine-hydrolyzing) n=1 Tax=Ancylomarina subtilis TaxID=1639035 RepID=A0A4Q7VKR4_9BACT|nr:asparagine synthase (glutamine-hydrolyzing) [Ancylomarina subtilis]RZT96802.1 asparagine synthase (glutamine-hydrolysing) [Ancylomarina subtilis]
MCGIVGFYPCCKINDSVEVLKCMLTRIKHRGPDQSGILLTQDIGLGSVRLSIIDIDNGRMPLSNEDDRLWIVFNGEIYNYLDLKKDLLQKGHVFKTTTDTEVVLHLYEEYGVECLNQLNGQFAIAIWDSLKKELFLARDRVGIRPLFYCKHDGGIVFASEMKALFEHPQIEAQISSLALSQIFTFWTTLSPLTVFKDIFEVQPGHFILANDKEIREEKYWELPLCKSEEYQDLTIDEAIDKFRILFSDAVKIRLKADVPVGAYLSGGLDSSITTSFIKANIQSQLQTFSLSFEDKEYDEAEYQKKAVDFFETEHRSIQCVQDDISQRIADIIWHLESPILRSAPAPMGLLSGLVKKNDIKVVITGEGADELLGGYNIFKEAIIRQFWARNPQSKIRPLLLKRLYPYMSQMNGAKALNLFFSYKLTETDSLVYSHLLRWKNTSRIKQYLSDHFKSELNDYDPVQELEAKLGERFKGVDLLSRAQWLEINLFMSGYLLSSQGDRMAMANSVEGRYPFLDHRIIEFCMKLPPEFKLKCLDEKFLLKKMMRGQLPDAILNRPKQAYRSPSVSYADSDYVKDLLSNEAIESAGLFNPDRVKKLSMKMNSGKNISEVDKMAFMGILSTQILNDLFVKKHKKALNKSELIDCKLTLLN